MKKHLTILALLLAAILLLTACGGGSEPAVKPTEELTGGDSMENAQKIAVNTKYHGTYEDGEAWFSFKTREQEDVKYAITLTNLTVDSAQLISRLYDETGTELFPISRSYSENWSRFVVADQCGMAVTGWTNTLEPDKTYFFRIEGGSKAAYSLLITDPTQEMVPEAERPAIADVESFYTATNMDEAPLITANTRYQDKYEGGFQWISFTTGPEEDVNYSITFDNLTVNGASLVTRLYDKNGTELFPTARSYRENWSRFVVADQNGMAATGWNNALQPDSTYFIRLEGESKVHYSILFTDPAQDAAENAEERAVIPDKDSYSTATNMDEAPLLTANTRYHGKYTEGFSWVAFTTGAEEDVNYSVTLENLSVGSAALTARLYDKNGKELFPTRRSYDEHWSKFIAAGESGTAATGWINTLQPDSTYFLRLEGGSKAEYTLLVGDPTSDPAAAADAFGVESNVDQDLTIVPGTSQSSAIKLPLGTKVYGKYVDGFAWLAFSTTELEDADYYITAVNKSVGSKQLTIRLYDEYGKELFPTKRSYDEHWSKFTTADQCGMAVTGWINTLTPNSTYYVRIEGGSKANYSMLISSPGQISSAYKTSSNIGEAVSALGENDEYYTATNQDDATMLKTNVRYAGRYTDGFQWVAFTTGSLEDLEYAITLEDQTVGSKDLILRLYDEYGRELFPDRRSYEEHWQRFLLANQSGTAATGWTKALQPDTTYYIRIEGGSKADYILLIGEPKPQQEGNTIAEVPAEPEPEVEVVFEVPFELNETQVRFAADQATFIDEAAAKEALEPVAKVILEHPDHKILLAGTTATFGDQTACVNLSNARAEAVKNMLVNTFGVPEDQLLTVGLGYEDDPFERGRDVDSSGKFVPTEAAKNRRVIVMDAETDIAKQVLGN